MGLMASDSDADGVTDDEVVVPSPTLPTPHPLLRSSGTQTEVCSASRYPSAMPPTPNLTTAHIAPVQQTTVLPPPPAPPPSSSLTSRLTCKLQQLQKCWYVFVGKPLKARVRRVALPDPEPDRPEQKRATKGKGTGRERQLHEGDAGASGLILCREPRAIIGDAQAEAAPAACVVAGAAPCQCWCR